jgi:hypothetical protein
LNKPNKVDSSHASRKRVVPEQGQRAAFEERLEYDVLRRPRRERCYLCVTARPTDPLSARSQASLRPPDYAGESALDLSVPNPQHACGRSAVPLIHSVADFIDEAQSMSRVTFELRERTINAGGSSAADAQSAAVACFA